MKNFIIFLLFSLYLSVFGNNEAELKLFSDANKYYRNGEYANAIVNYENILKNNKASAEVYYNLGNSYFKLKNYSEAILNYERAKLINPSDPELELNLAIANAKIIDKIDVLPELGIISFFKSIRDSFNSNAWSILTIAFAWMTIIFFILFNLSLGTLFRKLAFIGSLIFILIFLSSFSLAYYRYNYELNNNAAIINATSVYIKSNPSETSQNAFELHNGTKVIVLNSNGNYSQIKISNGSIGWIPTKYISKVF